MSPFSGEREDTFHDGGVVREIVETTASGPASRTITLANKNIQNSIQKANLDGSERTGESGFSGLDARLISESFRYEIKKFPGKTLDVS